MGFGLGSREKAITASRGPEPAINSASPNQNIFDICIVPRLPASDTAPRPPTPQNIRCKKTPPCPDGVKFGRTTRCLSAPQDRLCHDSTRGAVHQQRRLSKFMTLVQSIRCGPSLPPRNCERSKHGPASVRSVGVTGPCIGSLRGRAVRSETDGVAKRGQIGTSRSSHWDARFLICSKFRIAGSPSRMIVARLRSFGSRVIARDTAERSFIRP
jgi:hypothetical protein